MSKLYTALESFRLAGNSEVAIDAGKPIHEDFFKKMFTGAKAEKMINMLILSKKIKVAETKAAKEPKESEAKK